MSFAVVPGQEYRLLRFCKETHVVDRLPAVAIVIDLDGDPCGLPPDVRTASGDALYGSNVDYWTATLCPTGRVFDTDCEFESEEAWTAQCKRIASR